MKGAFEGSLVAYVGFFFLSINISLLGILMSLDHARAYKDYAIMKIESADRYDEWVHHQILLEQDRCGLNCLLSVTKDSVTSDGQVVTHYRVSVNYPIEIPLLQLRYTGSISGVTQAIWE